MASSANIDIPDKFSEWPHDARAFVLAEANTAIGLRRELDALAGITSTDYESDSAGQFTKEQLSMLILALGGPQDAETDTTPEE